MKIFYYCYGSAHSSVTSANLHLGNLPANRPASPREIFHQPLFDRTEDYGIGMPYFMGVDDAGHEIYVIGLAGGKQVIAPALLQFLAVMGVDGRAVRMEDALQNAGTLLRIGGYTSRRLGLVWIGRPLCALGVWLHFRRFQTHVLRVKASLRSGAQAT